MAADITKKLVTAWNSGDIEAIGALYADSAFWQQHPFRDPEPGYITRVFAEEESAQCEFGAPIVDGDRAVVPWSGNTRLIDGGTEDLVGVSLLRFDADGLVVDQRDICGERRCQVLQSSKPPQRPVDTSHHSGRFVSASADFSECKT